MIHKTRVRVKNGKVEEAPKGFKYWQYPKLLGWTDIRYVFINPKEYDIHFDYHQYRTVSQIAKKHNALLAFNFPFFWDGQVIGWAKGDDDLRTLWTPKLTEWSEFYVDHDGFPHIVDQAKDGRFIVQGSPRLIKDGKIVVDQQTIKEKVAPDILASNPRTAVGIDSRGWLVVCVVDGRSKWDKGLTLPELAHVMKWLGCTDALNGDGGGSSTLYYNGKVQNALSDGKERIVHHAIYIKRR